MENLTEPAVRSDLLHLRAGISDGDETAARFLRAYGLLHALKEILFEDVGLESRTGFAGDDEKSLSEIELAFACLDLRRVGGIENVQTREAVNFAKGHGQNFRSKARPSHTQQENAAEVFFLYFFGHTL